MFNNLKNIITGKPTETEILKARIAELETALQQATAKLAPQHNDIDVLNGVINSLKQNINVLRSKQIALDAEIIKSQQEYDTISNNIIELRDEVLLQSFALYRPTYEFTNVELYKVKLEQIRAAQKQLLKSDLAAKGATDWTVNKSAAQGKKLVNDTKKLLLRAFNSECEYIVSKVKYNNFDTCLKRMESSAESIEKLGAIMEISINKTYYDLKVAELKLSLEYQLAKQKEKEHQKELREQAREEAKVQKQLQEERAKAEKERKHYTKALAEAQKTLASCVDPNQMQALTDKINEIQSHLDVVATNIANIDYRETNQKAGYVYIISNIGSFGEDVYKIGMTRRLDPLERISELGDASVPFNFDVHAMIFSDDAPKLEASLHHAFEKNKLNMINKRREFFNVTLAEIERVVKQNFDGTVEFIKVAEAEQYRQSIKLREIL